jgi:hypothetical protein
VGAVRASVYPEYNLDWSAGFVLVES